MQATISLKLLDRVRVASPCPAKWEQMEGDDRSRFCHQCKLTVHNFSAMTQAEIEQLILGTDGRVCGRLYLRADGTIITNDCPVGLAALRRRARQVASRIAAAIVFALGGFAFARIELPRSSRLVNLGSMQPFASISRWLNPDPPVMIMGDVAVAPPANSQPNAPPTNTGASTGSSP